MTEKDVALVIPALHRVIPAQAGIYGSKGLDPRLRGDDGVKGGDDGVKGGDDGVKGGDDGVKGGDDRVKRWDDEVKGGELAPPCGSSAEAVSYTFVPPRLAWHA